MKIFKKVLTAILAVAPAVYSAVAVLFILPDTVPAHFGVTGTPDRYGSKYEAFLLPAFTLASYAVYLIVAANVKKKGGEKAARNLDTAATVMTASFVLFNVLCAVTLTAMSDPDVMSKNNSLMYVALNAAVGIVFIICGNIMPKTKRNAIIGMRLPFCMDTDEHWYIANRAGGIAMVIAGLVTVIGGLVLRSVASTIVMIISLILFPTVAIIYSYVKIKGENK